jgi:hypothetical protein
LNFPGDFGQNGFGCFNPSEVEGRDPYFGIEFNAFKSHSNAWQSLDISILGSYDNADFF